MKKRLLLLTLAVLLTLATGAENYPYHSDWLWVTTPSHADWNYQTGEQARVHIQLLHYGMPYEGAIDYSIGNDMQADEQTGTLTLKDGRATLSVGTLKQPGFRDLRLRLKNGRQTLTSHHVKVGFSPEKIRPVTKEPSDFLDYWQRALEQDRKFKLDYTIEPVETLSTGKSNCYLMKLRLNRQGQTMYGYLFVPKQAKPKSCPVVLCPPGAGVKTIREYTLQPYYADKGCVRLVVEIHGLDPRMPESYFDNVRSAFSDYLSFGLEDRDAYYMRHVYLGLVRCIDLLTSLPEWDGMNVVTQGGSQGGALAIVAAALHPAVTHCIANHPALSDMAGLGYPHFNRKQLTPSVLHTLSYYDVVNFARHLKAHTFLTWGYNDDVCPPTTSWAVWNTLTCEKEKLVTPVNEHWTSETTDQQQLSWLLKHLIGSASK